MKKKQYNGQIKKLSVIGLIVTLGIVYGDIGTSPLYVLRAIVTGLGNIHDPNFNNYIYGAISCIFWTLTIQTTIKYIIITLRADNKGEGGIFSLYALLRRRVKWVFIFAIIGGAALLADGVITPAITVTSAIEGINMLNLGIEIPLLPIILIIITLIFVIQQTGTNLIGKSFGPIMFIWFLMLGLLGIFQIIDNPYIFKSLNPYYAYLLLSKHPSGFLLLGAVFLCTTGAEALYSDLGHCGLKNIRFTWMYVKTCLVLNYLGQGAWIIKNINILGPNENPFYSIMADWFLLPGIIISTAAAIIASQALISGSYTIISEAILLNFWPKVKINYPTTIKGQMYVPSINWLLWISCIFVILYFRESSKMEAAYGLAITITMMMTTFLLTFYLLYRRISIIFIVLFVIVYMFIEISFLIANLHKFPNGGFVTIIIAGIVFIVMYTWYKARNIKKRFLEFVKFDNYKVLLKDISADNSIPKYATNLVYLTRADKVTDIESKIIYSIINKHPKRADVYWFVHVDVLDDPHTTEYKITKLIGNSFIRIDLRLGFKVEPKINLFLKQVVDEMVQNNEIDVVSRYDSLKKHNVMGDFRFIVIDRIQNYDFDFGYTEQLIMDIYDKVKRFAISDTKAFGLDASTVTVEDVPLTIERDNEIKLNRTY